MKQNPMAAPLWVELRSHLEGRGHQIDRLEPLSGDVSRRAYARVHHSPRRTAVLAAYPRDMRSDLERFERTSSLLEAASVRVPRILDRSVTEGWMLLEDVGDRSLYDAAVSGEAETSALLRRARDLIGRIRSVDTADVASLGAPPLNADLLWSECQATLQSLPPELIQHNEVVDLGERLQGLCLRCDEHVFVPSHRDYMARNLMLLGRELVVIDHQDLRLAPRAYDAASLFSDSIQLPEEQLEREWAAIGVPRQEGHELTTQRMFKILGTFVRFANAGDSRYVGLLPGVWERFLLGCKVLWPNSEWIDRSHRRMTPWIDRFVGASR